MIWNEIVRLWETCTPMQRFRLLTLAFLSAVLVVMVVDLVEAAWLELAELAAQALREALS